MNIFTEAKINMSINIKGSICMAGKRNYVCHGKKDHVSVSIKGIICMSGYKQPCRSG